MFGRTYSDLGPVVGQINGEDIRANQLERRGYDWENGYGTPSDGQDTNRDGQPVRKLTKDAKSIIIFWSCSGSTKLLASKVACETGADILEITLRNPYPANYRKTLNRANCERIQNDSSELEMQLPDLSQYDTIYLGYQTWTMTLSQPMKAFLLEYGGEFSNKEIAPFLSEGGYGSGDSTELIREFIARDGGKNKKVDWTFVGPENVLCAGITDKFEKAGQKIFGPNQRTAQLEGSKDYALRFMNKYDVPTARHETFTSAETCIAGLKDFAYPVVIKEDGLAGGKGVTIAKNQDVAEETIREMFAGGQTAVVLEECLVGPEYSMFVAVSEDQFTILPMAQDHKRVGDGDKGPNTGGMGSYSPLPQLKKEDRQRMIDEIVKPTMNGLVQGDYHYCGVLYIGLMMTENGPKVIEYNVRLGDPETQVVLPRIKNDFAMVIDAAVNHEKLPEIEENDNSILGVVVCSKGYPAHPAPNVKIGKLPEGTNTYIDYANVKGELDNLIGDGGRLFMVISEADNLVQAQDNVYSYLSKLDLPDCFYRHDIGNRALRDQMCEESPGWGFFSLI